MKTKRIVVVAVFTFPLFSSFSNAESRLETPETWFSEGKAAIEEAIARKPIEKTAKNVILFVGDGMGISTVTAARIFEGQLRGENGEENWLSFERMPYTALSKTYTTDHQTPDSAGTMTAMMTGVKTKSGLISVDQNAQRGKASSGEGRELLTLLEKAELAGKATGIVSTARLTHATPAACYAHSVERGWESDADVPENETAVDIAAQLIDMPAYWSEKGFPNVDGPEVAFGGGRSAFFPEGAISDYDSNDGDRGKRRDGRNLAIEWTDSRENGNYVYDLDTFDALDPNTTGPALGLFSSSHMEYETDRLAVSSKDPSLEQMTRKAIEILKRRDKGYFLMVEAGRIDHAHHANNAYRALMDAVALSKAVAAALEMTDEEDTLIVVTADHSHVFTMAGYPARGNQILGLVIDGNGNLALDEFDSPYATLGYMNGPGYLGESDEQPEGFKRFPHSFRSSSPVSHGRPDLREFIQTPIDEMSSDDFVDHLQESAYPKTSETHGGEDVGIWARGPYAHLLHGTVEQNVIFHLMDYAMGMDVEDPFQ